MLVFFFFFNDTATTEIYTLSLHDALPDLTRLVAVTGASNLIGTRPDVPAITARAHDVGALTWIDGVHLTAHAGVDRKSTRLNSSHANISYAVFCLKKKNKTVAHL